MTSKILVAIDSSEKSKSVFDTAVSLAQSTDANLMLLHVLSAEDPRDFFLSDYAYYSAIQGNNGDILHQKFAEYEQIEVESLHNLTQKAIAQGVKAEYAQLRGIPGVEICELAKAWSADLILVGSRGLKGLKEMFIGSVSNYVTHHAPCSVLIVRSSFDAKSIDSSVGQEMVDNQQQHAAN